MKVTRLFAGRSPFVSLTRAVAKRYRRTSIWPSAYHIRTSVFGTIDRPMTLHVQTAGYRGLHSGSHVTFKVISSVSLICDV